MPSICTRARSGYSITSGITNSSGASASVRVLCAGFDAIAVPFVHNNPDTGPDHPLAKTEKTRLGFKRCDIFAGYLKGMCIRTRIFNLPVQQFDQPLLCYSLSGGWLQGHFVSRQGPLLLFLFPSRSHPFIECVIFSYRFGSPV